MKTIEANSAAVNRELNAAIEKGYVVKATKVKQRESSENKYVYMVLACAAIFALTACVCGWIPTGF